MYPDTILAFHLKFCWFPDSKPEGPEAMVVSSMCLKSVLGQARKDLGLFMVGSSCRWPCWGEQGKADAWDV